MGVSFAPHVTVFPSLSSRQRKGNKVRPLSDHRPLLVGGRPMSTLQQGGRIHICQPSSSSDPKSSSVCGNCERIRQYVVLYQTRQRAAVSAWTGLIVGQLTYPGTGVARLIEETEEKSKGTFPEDKEMAVNERGGLSFRTLRHHCYLGLQLGGTSNILIPKP